MNWNWPWDSQATSPVSRQPSQAAPTTRHPPHTAPFIAALAESGQPHDRGTGRTTALALEYLAAAIRNPRVPIRVQDHHPTRRASEYLLQVCSALASRLNLQHLTFNRAKLTITFE